MDPYCDVEGPPGRNCAIANVLARWLPAARVVEGKKKCWCCATTQWHQHQDFKLEAHTRALPGGGLAGWRHMKGLHKAVSSNAHIRYAFCGCFALLLHRQTLRTALCILRWSS